MKDDLVSALELSLTEGTKDIAANIAQMGIDAILKDGAFQGIPILATVTSVYKIGHSIKELHYIKKLAQFVFALNYRVETEEQRQYYISRVIEDRDRANKELEYILVLIDRYIQFSKVDMLAKLYLSYLRKEISWEEFSVYSEVTDRLLPGDYETLRSLQEVFSVRNGVNGESILRLSAVGMVYEHENNSPYDVVGTGENQCLFMHKGSMERTVNHERIYKRTQSGNRFVEIIEGE